jgi:hypothetical protein
MDSDDKGSGYKTSLQDDGHIKISGFKRKQPGCNTGPLLRTKHIMQIVLQLLEK